MIKIIMWFILSYGLMNIMVYGKIFEGLRTYIQKYAESEIKLKFLFKFVHEILSCPLCFSTWGGFFLGIIIWSPINSLFQIPREFSWFFDGILSSGGVWIINTFVEFFEENRINGSE
jgi:hypothetical protein